MGLGLEKQSVGSLASGLHEERCGKILTWPLPKVDSIWFQPNVIHPSFLRVTYSLTNSWRPGINQTSERTTTTTQKHQQQQQQKACYSNTWWLSRKLTVGSPPVAIEKIEPWSVWASDSLLEIHSQQHRIAYDLAPVMQQSLRSSWKSSQQRKWSLAILKIGVTRESQLTLMMAAEVCSGSFPCKVQDFGFFMPFSAASVPFSVSLLQPCCKNSVKWGSRPTST